MLKRTFFCLLCFICSIVGFANETAPEPEESTSLDQMDISIEEPVHFELIARENSFTPGRPLLLAIRMNMAEGWHAYWKNPGDSGMPLQIEWTLPEGFTLTNLQWPTPKRFEVEGMIGYGYESEVFFLAEITPPKSLPKDTQVPIEANVRWLVCSNSMCLPGDSELALNFPLSNSSTSSQLFDKARSTLPKKMTSIKAKRSDNFIEIQLKSSAATLQHVDFYPESKKTIDEKVPAAFAATTDAPDETTLLLKEHDLNQETHLKGILVLQDTHSSQAWEVNIPIEGEKNLNPLTLAENTPPRPQLKSESYEDDTLSGGATASNILLAFVFAFIGGLILNFMPCVLPVISLKILSFVKMAGQNRMATLKHGLAFFFGVIASFWFLAGAMLALQSYGHAIGWGFQLQEPIFVALLSALLLLFALNFFGLFEVGTSLTSLAGQAQHASKTKTSALMSSFCSGILATALATPCTGPFLGTAIGFAVTLPPILAIAIFTVLGAGMAFPYLLLSAYPSLLRFLPKPGSWMTTFKALMGFVMLSTVLWLLWVFGAQTSNLALFILLASLLLLSFAAWIYGNYCTPMNSKISYSVGSLFALSCTVISVYAIAMASSSDMIDAPNSFSQIAVKDGSWEPYSPERVKELQDKGVPVLIDFTAKWCLICQANHLVLSSQTVSQKLQEIGAVKMKADWTRRDPVITQALRSHGRSGVPLYVLTSRDNDKADLVLPQVLTPEIVINYLNQL